MLENSQKLGINNLFLDIITPKGVIFMSDKKIYKPIPQNDGFPPVASTEDFTGLVPAGLSSQQELEAYNEMYAFIPPVSVNTQNDKNSTK